MLRRAKRLAGEGGRGHRRGEGDDEGEAGGHDGPRGTVAGGDGHRRPPLPGAGVERPGCERRRVTARAARGNPAARSAGRRLQPAEEPRDAVECRVRKNREQAMAQLRPQLQLAPGERRHRRLEERGPRDGSEVPDSSRAGTATPRPVRDPGGGVLDRRVDGAGTRGTQGPRTPRPSLRPRARRPRPRATRPAPERMPADHDARLVRHLRLERREGLLGLALRQLQRVRLETRGRAGRRPRFMEAAVPEAPWPR